MPQNYIIYHEKIIKRNCIVNISTVYVQIILTKIMLILQEKLKSIFFKNQHTIIFMVIRKMENVRIMKNYHKRRGERS